MPNKSPEAPNDLDKFREIVELFTERLTRKDFTTAFSAVTDSVVKVRDELNEKATALADAVDAAKASLEEQAASKLSEAQQTLTEAVTAAIQTLETKVAEVDTRLGAIRDGKDGISPDIEEVAKAAAALIILPEYRAPMMDGPEDLRNKLETYAEVDNEEEKLDPRIIRGLKDLIEEVEKLKKQKAGGSSQMLVSHWPIHENFTMDGIATTVTLQQGPAAQGTAIFGLRYQGQNQVFGTDYTVSGNKVTFVTFTPEAGTIIDISYVP
jgi:hypothetical protein